MAAETRYFERLAAAYVRGRLDSSSEIRLEDLTALQLQETLERGLAAGLRLHRFKRTMGLPRVQRVLGMLRGLRPESLLDVGSGRGAFLWPLLDAFPGLPVSAVDVLDYRVADIEAVRAGGIATLSGVQADVTRLPFANDEFDGATLLEVLEHIPDPAAALREAARVSRRFLLVSVPSQPDDNPEHIHLFTRERMEGLLLDAGAVRIKWESVLNHFICLVMLR